MCIGGLLLTDRRRPRREEHIIRSELIHDDPVNLVSPDLISTGY